MKRVVLLLIAALALPAQATTLKQLLDAAQKANLERRISAEQRRRASSDFTAAWTSFFPSITASGGWTRNQFPAEFTLPNPAAATDPSAPPTRTLTIIPKDQLDLVVRVELPLIDPTRWMRAAVAGAADDAAGYRDELMSDNVQRQVAATYYSYAAALAFRESARKSVGFAEAQSQLQEIRLRAGSATELEVLRAKAEVQRNRQTLADSESLVANARRALRTQTGLEVEETAVLPPDNLILEGSLEELEKNADTLPAVRAAEKDALAASRLETAARLALVPIVSANFTERLTNATGFTGQVNSYTAGLGLLWRFEVPALYGMSGQSSAAEIARLASERQKLASRDQIHSDWQRLNAAIQKVTAARTQVESAQRASQMAKDRYVAGAATQIDVIQSDRDLFSAEVNHIQARTELASSHVGLQLSAGLPLKIE